MGLIGNYSLHVIEVHIYHFNPTNKHWQHAIVMMAVKEQQSYRVIPFVIECFVPWLFIS
jgi:hypothetical protein